MGDILTASFFIGILASGIRLATPYLYAAIGETLGQRSGVLNLGVEGQMLMGAFADFYVVFNTDPALTVNRLTFLVLFFLGLVTILSPVSHFLHFRFTRKQLFSYFNEFLHFLGAITTLTCVLVSACSLLSSPEISYFILIAVFLAPLSFSCLMFLA